MKAVLQRVSKGCVSVNEELVGTIEKGIVVLLGITYGDDNENIFSYILDKIVNLRIFEDNDGKMNLSANDLGYSILIIPNFTIYAETVKGRRPSFEHSAKHEQSKIIFEKFIDYARKKYTNGSIETGIFGEDMKVEILNDGPVTLIIEKQN